MKISKILLLAIATLGMSSCMTEELQSLDVRGGSMTLAVDKLVPSATRAVETDNFPVNIYNESGELYSSYGKVTDVPSKVKLPVGMYYVESHTPGDFEKYMDAPYYSGQENFEIRQAITTNAKVVCRMANGSITVKFAEDADGQHFSEVFKEWSITITDSKSIPLVYTKDEHGYNPPTTYVKFEEKVEVLTLNFTGTTNLDVPIKTSHNLTKANASERYDDDEIYFSGGDMIVVTLSPSEKVDGQVTGIELKADIRFEESDEDIEMEVEDNTDEFEELPDTPGDEDEPIVLDLPENMVIDANTDPARGDAEIGAAAGIKSILVKISSTSAGMMEAIAALDSNSDGQLDFTGDGTEVVGNNYMSELLGGLLGAPMPVPSAGDKEYVFPIGNFFGMLLEMQGVHTFEMTVTDMDGNTKTDKLVLAVGEELPEEEEPEETASIVLNLPEDMVVDDSTDPTQGDAKISAVAGIQSILVKISSTSAGMMEALGALDGNSEGQLDFTGNGTEVVGNSYMSELLGGLLGAPMPVPFGGEKEYVFPIGNFFGMLAEMPGVHSFEMIVTDMNGKTETDTLVLTVEE